MSNSSRLLRSGALNLSPAVEPSPKPIRSDSGAASVASARLAPGTRIQNKDALSGAWDGVTVDASGKPLLDIAFDGPGPGFKWTVERAGIGSNAAHWLNCQVHVGRINERNPYLTLVDYSELPNAAVADESSPIYVDGGNKLTFRFIGTPATVAGDDATARIQYTSESE